MDKSFFILYIVFAFMKVTISFLRTLSIWLIAFFVGALVIGGCFFTIFFKPWDILQPVLISIYILLMVALLAFSLKANFYIVTDKYIEVHKFGKVYLYTYSDIFYIDEQYSIKTKTLTFVTKHGHVKYLTFDKDGTIFSKVMKGCKNLKSRQEILALFPSIKL